MIGQAYLRRWQAADYLREKYGLSTANSLAKLATVGGGPRFQKLGRIVLYRQEDLDEWVTSRLSPPVFNTSEVAA